MNKLEPPFLRVWVRAAIGVNKYLWSVQIWNGIGAYSVLAHVSVHYMQINLIWAFDSELEGAQCLTMTVIAFLRQVNPENNFLV